MATRRRVREPATPQADEVAIHHPIAAGRYEDEGVTNRYHMEPSTLTYPQVDEPILRRSKAL